MIGRSKCEIPKNLSFGVTQESRSSQTSWVLDSDRVGIGRGLVEPGDHGLARPARKGMGEPRLEDRQRGKRRAAFDDEFSAWKCHA